MDKVEDEQLFDEIYEYADECPWFDTTQFVDDVYAQFQSRLAEAENLPLFRSLLIVLMIVKEAGDPFPQRL
jgi:hypothetical protein